MDDPRRGPRPERPMLAAKYAIPPICLDLLPVTSPTRTG